MNRAILLLALPLLGVPALAQHRDVSLSIEEGQVVTSAFDFEEPGSPPVPSRVFWSDLGEGIPHFTDDPGFSAPSGALPPGSPVGFDVLDSLRIWNPALQNFDQTPPETMFIGLSGVSVTTPTTPGTFVPGFDFAVASGGGSVHQHLNFFLNPPQGEGVYRLTLSMRVSGAEPSEPIYLIFQQGEGAEMDAMHEEAIAWQIAELEPSCPADFDGDADVDFDDLGILLGAFGVSDAGDADGDGDTDFDDLGVLLGAFGTPC